MNNIFDICQNGNYKTVKQFLQENSIDINAKNNNGETPLHIVCKRDDIKIVELLLAFGADPQIVSSDFWEITPVVNACYNNNLDIMKLLIRSYYDIYKTDYKGDTLLHSACNTVNININIIKYLIEECEMEINKKNNEGMTPFHYACWCSTEGKTDVRVLKYLLDKGAKINDKDINDRNPLYCAMFNSFLIDDNNYDVVKFLLENGASTNTTFDHYIGCTLLDFVCTHGQLNIIELLYEHGVDFRSENSYGKTPYMIACENNHKHVMEYLKYK